MRTCDLTLAFSNILSGVHKPCYYVGMVAESKTTDEASFAEGYLKDEIGAQVLAGKLLAWHMRSGRSGLQPVRPTIAIKTSVTLKPGKVLVLVQDD